MNAILTRWSRPGSFVSARYSDDPGLELAMVDEIGVWETAYARFCTTEVVLMGRKCFMSWMRKMLNYGCAQRRTDKFTPYTPRITIVHLHKPTSGPWHSFLIFSGLGWGPMVSVGFS